MVYFRPQSTNLYNVCQNHNTNATPPPLYHLHVYMTSQLNENNNNSYKTYSNKIQPHKNNHLKYAF